MSYVKTRNQRGTLAQFVIAMCSSKTITGFAVVWTLFAASTYCCGQDLSDRNLKVSRPGSNLPVAMARSPWLCRSHWYSKLSLNRGDGSSIPGE
jgi:hypothetical protein